MAAVTYPNEEVATLVNEEVVPVQLPSNELPYAEDYNVRWTPAFYILDSDGNVHESSVGFLPPGQFIPFLYLGMAKAYHDMEKYEEALAHLGVVIDEYPDSQYRAEAIYLRGVTKYKMTHEEAGLIEAYEILHREYPGSEWARKAEPYALLKKEEAA